MSEICRRGERVTSAVSGSCLKIASLQVFCPVPAKIPFWAETGASLGLLDLGTKIQDTEKGA